jgi:hypothetical protein
MSMGLRSFIRDVRKFTHRLSLKATPPFVYSRGLIATDSVQAQDTQTSSHDPQLQRLAQESLAPSIDSGLLNSPSEHCPQPVTTQPHFSETSNVCFIIILTFSRAYSMTDFQHPGCHPYTGYLTRKCKSHGTCPTSHQCSSRSLSLQAQRSTSLAPIGDGGRPDETIRRSACRKEATSGGGKGPP